MTSRDPPDWSYSYSISRAAPRTMLDPPRHPILAQNVPPPGQHPPQRFLRDLTGMSLPSFLPSALTAPSESSSAVNCCGPPGEHSSIPGEPGLHIFSAVHADAIMPDYSARSGQPLQQDSPVLPVHVGTPHTDHFRSPYLDHVGANSPDVNDAFSPTMFPSDSFNPLAMATTGHLLGHDFWQDAPVFPMGDDNPYTVSGKSHRLAHICGTMSVQGGSRNAECAPASSA